MSEQMPSTNLLRRIARIWSVIVLVCVVIIFILEIVFPHTDEAASIPFVEWLLLVFFPLGVLVGLGLAWKWELWGGVAALASYVAFMILLTVLRERFIWGMLIMGVLAAGPGILFILSATRADQEAAAL